MNDYQRKNIIPALMLIATLLLMRASIMKKLDDWQTKRQAKIHKD